MYEIGHRKDGIMEYLVGVGPVGLDGRNLTEGIVTR